MCAASTSLVRRLTLLAVLLAACLAGKTATANDFRGQLGEAAKGIAQLLSSRGQDSIAVGQFTGPANFPATAGPGIAKVLGEELEKQGVRVATRAALGVRGQFSITEVDETELSLPENLAARRSGAEGKVVGIRITGTVEDSFGNAVTDFSFDRVVGDEQDVVELAGLSVPLPLGAEDPAARDNAIRDALNNPRVHIAGGRVSASTDDPYGIEIVVDEAPRAATAEDGLAFVGLARGESYGVRLYNDSPYDAAVELSIDGLNMFAFSEMRHTRGPRQGEPLYSRVIVPAGKSAIVVGWHRTNRASDRFLITKYAESAAASLGQTAQVGTITATFSAAWDRDGEAPEDEPRVYYTVAEAEDGTGFGERVETDLQEVQREIGVVRSSISVRYLKGAE